MKTKKVETEVILDVHQIVTYLKDHISDVGREQWLEMFKIMCPHVTNEWYDEKNDKYVYSIISDEIMTWEEEVDAMTYMEVLSKFHQLLLSDKKLDVPPLSATKLDIYVREIVKRNEI